MRTLKARGDEKRVEYSGFSSVVGWPKPLTELAGPTWSPMKSYCVDIVARAYYNGLSEQNRQKEDLLSTQMGVGDMINWAGRRGFGPPRPVFIPSTAQHPAREEQEEREEEHHAGPDVPGAEPPGRGDPFGALKVLQDVVPDDEIKEIQEEMKRDERKLYASLDKLAAFDPFDVFSPRGR
jgi:hypothetical protein